MGVDRADLAARVRALLAKNRVVAGNGAWRYTRPAERTYPHQWLWDSCFHARIHHWLGDTDAARDELRATLRAQAQDGPDRGRVPHMTFLGADPADRAQDAAAAEQYARDRDLWQDSRASTITQPPLLAETALAIGDPPFWRELWPALVAHHDWWLRRRRVRGELVVCHHVWETGADATPRADAAFARLLATGRTPRALDKGTINLTAKKRADLLAARFLMLEDLQAIDADELAGRASADDAERRRLALYGHRAVEMHAFLVANLGAMARMADALGEAVEAARFRTEAADLAAAVNDRMWDEARGTYVDQWGDPPAPIDVATYAPFIALYAEDLVPPDRAQRLLAQLLDPDAFWTRWPVPTVARREACFDPDEYWRGSTWLNVNWFIVRGLVAMERRTGDRRALGAARTIAERTVELVADQGFREYYRSGARRPDDDDGASAAAFGPEGFSWSGLALDLARALDDELA